MKKRLKGYTRKSGKYQLVFQRGKKLIVDNRKFETKKSLVNTARKYLTKSTKTYGKSVYKPKRR